MSKDLIDALYHFGDNPIHSFSDLAAHALTGVVLAREFLPDAGKLKQAVASLVGGFLPDADLVVPGVTHRGITHGPFFSVAASSTVGLLSRSKVRFYDNPWFKITLYGTLLHQVVDKLSTVEEYGAYLTVAAVALTYQSFRKRGTDLNPKQ